MTIGEKASYKCSKCVDKIFKRLIGLRLHAALVHSTIEIPDGEKYEDTQSSDEKLLYETVVRSKKLAMESKMLKEIPETIDNMFDKFNRRAEILLQKYDRNFAEIEEELRLSAKLRTIKKKKDNLKSHLDGWHGNKKTTVWGRKNESYISTRPISDDEALKDEPPEKELKETPTFIIDEVSNPRNGVLQKKLNLSIQLAAKYKEQAIEMENRLQNAIRSEQTLRYYLQDAAEREADAKQRLQVFITGLLERAEAAEEKVKAYKTGMSDGKFNGKRSLTRFEPDVTATIAGNMKPSQSMAYSSSAPTTPHQPPHRIRKTRKNSPSTADDNYVAQFLEPPSSQELSRRWNKRRDRSVDQLPGIDLSNVIDTSVVWPFAQTCHSDVTPRSGHSAFGNSPMCSVTFQPHIATNDVAIRRRIVLFCVFAYVDTESLLRCSLVCREWRDVSKHPKLWTRVSLDSKHISSEFLATLAAWCKETCYISLSNIKGRNRHLGETSREYDEATAGSLEDGMECLLQACGSNLVILAINKCHPFLTRRLLWMASCYNRELKSITFRSTEPLNAEVTWSLGAGCRKLLSLDIAPLKSCKTPQIFNNRVVQMMSWCWPNLRGLSVGGRCIDKKGLLSIATNCHSVQVLELTYMNEITEDLAKALVKHGLGSLRSLILTHTPIRARALRWLLRLASERSLVGLRVQLSFADYCPTHNEQPAVIYGDNLDRSELLEAYNSVMQSLMKLQKRPAYTGVLQVICTA